MQGVGHVGYHLCKELTAAGAKLSVADVDKWEDADFTEEEAREKVKEAKQEYENALREKFFNF